MKAPIFTLILALSSSFAFASDQREKDAAAILALENAAKSLSEVDKSCELAEDCLIVTTGARACGGPGGYLYASKNNSNLAEIKYLAKKSTSKEQAFNSAYRVVSICSLLMIKPVECKNNLCQ